MKSEISAFSLLHPLIQQELYRMGWKELRKIQVESIKKMNENNLNMVISANTASGKTEAAFLPIISDMLTTPEKGITCLYIGPLKALINDQFMRVEELCEKTKLPVHKWHGDVSGSKKKKVRTSPKGILLLTPESLESIFINHTFSLYEMFSNLKYIVIDEMHSFIGEERGIHLKSLILRLNKITKKDMRVLGLSATLGDIYKAGQWMTENLNKSFDLINDTEDKKSVSYMILSYLIKAEETLSDENPYEEVANDIFNSFKDKTSLIFGNNKSKLEFLADMINEKAKSIAYKNPFRVHHGSLSKFEREIVEDELKSDKVISVFCSSTLEMGIDVGDVSIIGQIESPWSVNSLVQRLGRSGRKDGESSIMKVFITENEMSSHISILDKINENLIQSIALTELMIEKWIEPPVINKIHFSTLVHQILSLITQFGGASPLNLYSNLIKEGAFPNVSQSDFIEILKGLGQGKLIEQTPKGDLILGMLGEKIVRNYNFYSVFKSPDEIKVIFKGKVIGTILNDPGIVVENYLVLAGKRWKIIEIIKEKKEIIVKKAKGKKIPEFNRSSTPMIHKKVREKMKKVLIEETNYIYLNSRGKEMLSSARKSFSRLEKKQQEFSIEGKSIIWFTWTGTKINLTLFALTKYYLKMDVEMRNVALIFTKIKLEEIKEKLNSTLKEHPSSLELSRLFPLKSFEKYDDFLTEELKAISFANNYLDLEGALELIKKSKF